MRPGVSLSVEVYKGFTDVMHVWYSYVHKK